MRSDPYPDTTFIHFLPMSIEINPARITSVFALGQWHYVAPGSFGLDAYELVTDLGDDFPCDIVALGDYYPDGLHAHLGATWESQCGVHMALPLSEIKAFKFERS